MFPSQHISWDRQQDGRDPRILADRIRSHVERTRSYFEQLLENHQGHVYALGVQNQRTQSQLNEIAKQLVEVKAAHGSISAALDEERTAHVQTIETLKHESHALATAKSELELKRQVTKTENRTPTFPDEQDLRGSEVTDKPTGGLSRGEVEEKDRVHETLQERHLRETSGLQERIYEMQQDHDAFMKNLEGHVE